MNIPWLAVFEEFYHGYQKMFSDIFNTSRNPEFEAKVFSIGAYWEMVLNPSGPTEINGIGSTYNCPILEDFLIKHYNLSFKTLNSDAFNKDYISSGHSFIQYWINEGNSGRRVPFAYDWPVTHVPQTLKTLSFRTFLKTSFPKLLNK